MIYALSEQDLVLALASAKREEKKVFSYHPAAQAKAFLFGFL